MSAHSRPRPLHSAQLGPGPLPGDLTLWYVDAHTSSSPDSALRCRPQQRPLTQSPHHGRHFTLPGPSPPTELLMSLCQQGCGLCLRQDSTSVRALATSISFLETSNCQPVRLLPSWPWPVHSQCGQTLLPSKWTARLLSHSEPRPHGPRGAGWVRGPRPHSSQPRALSPDGHLPPSPTVSRLPSELPFPGRHRPPCFKPQAPRTHLPAGLDPRPTGSSAPVPGAVLAQTVGTPPRHLSTGLRKTRPS